MTLLTQLFHSTLPSSPLRPSFACVNQCLLCLSPSRTSLCTDCERDLPWQDTSCSRCALPLPCSGICPGCLKKPPSFDRAWAPLLFESPLKTLIHQFKYNGDLRSENFLKNMLAEYFSQSLQSDPFNIDVIVPVPLHYQRMLQRSFNQSYQLACTVAASINRPIDQSLVKRIRKTQRQEGLNAKQRQQNLHQAFQVSASVKGKDILLIDDVMTTGATAESISIQLKQQGAHSVSILCIARTPIHSG